MEKSRLYKIWQFVWVVAVFTAVMLAIGGLIGCRTGKHMVKSQTVSVVHDTVVVRVHDSLVHELHTVDTVIGIPGERIVLQYVHDTVIRKGHVQLSVKGGVIDCGADSLNKVIAGLIRERVYEMQRVDSARDHKESTLREVAAKDNRTFASKVAECGIDILALIGAIALIGLVVKRFTA